MRAIIERLSPNQNERPEGSEINTCVLHYTGMQTGNEALKRMCDPAAEVSAHYMIEEDGRIFRLVPEAKRAWHAGVSAWRGVQNLNHTSIGIELVHPGHEWGYRPFAERQIEALLGLLAGIHDRHPIAPLGLVGHSDIAPGRKQDPGELFPWSRLADAGFGIIPQNSAPYDVGVDSLKLGDACEQVSALQKHLVSLGYSLNENGTYDEETHNCVTAFQYHWRQTRVDGKADAETIARLKALLGQTA